MFVSFLVAAPPTSSTIESETIEETTIESKFFYNPTTKNFT